MRSVIVGCLLLTSAVSCTFETTPLASSNKKDAAAASATKRSDAGRAAHSVDAATPADAADSALRADAAVAAPDASVQPDASAQDGGAVPTRDEAGVVGSDAFGTNPTPNDPMMPAQTGGLQCNGVFCPFAVDPVKPCCTTQSDVAHGAARSADLCGLDLSATGSSFFGNLCWQRDQPGVVDNNCPGTNVDATAHEPGCCSDQGLCGALNSDHALGCHYEPDQPPRSCVTGTGGGKSCDPLGVFGIRAEVDLAWGGRSGGLAALTDDGRGTQVVHLLANIDGIDASTLELSGTFKPCGVELPTFYSTTLCEAYKPIFPSKIWDSNAVSGFPLSGRLACLQPGCVESIDARTVLLGIQLNNPEAPWPTANGTANLTCPRGSGQQCFPDDDGDKLPGLTVEVATSGMAPPSTGCSGQYRYQGAPLSASIAAIFGGVRRTDRILLGVRMKIGGSAKLADDCNGGLGSGVAEFVNSRAWGCVVERGTYNFPFAATAAGANDLCTSSEAAFMDANLPVYSILAVGTAPNPMLTLKDVSPSKGPQIRMVRLGSPGAPVSCADVRAAKYP